MKSVGEAMAIGRTFKESLQKALRSLEIELGPSQVEAVFAPTDDAFAALPAGTLDLGPRSFTLKTSGSYASLEQVREAAAATR